MLPKLPGIRELVKFMRNDVPVESHRQESSGVRYGNGFVDTSDTLNCVMKNEDSVEDITETCLTVSHEFHNSVMNSEIKSANPPKPIYTVLTSKNRSEITRISDTNKLKNFSNKDSTCPSEIPTTQPNPIYKPETADTTFLALNPTSNAGQNERLYPPVQSSVNHLTKSKTQEILPKPIVLISNTNATLLPAMPKLHPTAPVLYQLLNQNIPSTTSVPIISVIQMKPVDNPTHLIPTAKTKTNLLPAKHYQATSTLHRNSNHVQTYPQIQHKTSPAAPIISNIEPSRSCSDVNKPTNRQTKSILKANKSSTNRKPVRNCVAESRCDGRLSDVKVELGKKELWKLFYDEENEMVVTKQGRPMFPALDFNVSGLNSQEMYSISMRFVLMDKYRYHFNTSLGKWEALNEDRKQPGNSRCFQHPLSPASGHTWSKNLVAFNELRLTNHTKKDKSLVCLSTMRRYHVQLVISILRCSCCHGEHTRHVDIPLTKFIAVSSYYNAKITQLKIAHNPMNRTKFSNGQRKRKSEKPKSNEEALSIETKRQKMDGEFALSTLSNLNTSSIFESTSSSLPLIPLLSTTTATIDATDVPKISQTGCNTVYTCQNTKPITRAQNDEDILEYIKLYLSPFQSSERKETFDSTVFDELCNINYISDKWDNFDDITHLPLF